MRLILAVSCGASPGDGALDTGVTIGVHGSWLHPARWLTYVWRVAMLDPADAE